MDVEAEQKLAAVAPAYTKRPDQEDSRKDIHRKPQSHTRVGDIHKPSNMALNRRATQQQINLIIAVPEPTQILDTPKRGLAVRHGGVQVVLLSVLVDAEAFEGEIATGTVMRFDGSGEEERRFHAEVGHAVLHDGEFEGDDAGHFDGATEGDLAVTLCILLIGGRF